MLGLDDGKKRFFDVVLAMNKAWSLCSTLDEAKPLQKEIAFLSAVKVAIIKLTTTDKNSVSQRKIRYSVKSSITPLLRRA